MATTAKTPQARLNDLTAVVDALESGFRDRFAHWERGGHVGPEEHFLWTYSEAVNTIKLISSEKWKNEDPNLSPHLDQLEERVIPLFGQSVDYIKETGFRLSRVHKGLVRALRSLTRWGNCDLQGLRTHTIHMFMRLQKIQPPPRAAWNEDASDMKPSEEFEEIFEKFVALKKISHNFEFKHEMFVSQSYQLLKDACEALNIAGEKAYPDERFFENECRPAWIEYPYGSKEFTYGKRTRPGILSLKSSLGMPLSAKDTRRIQRVREGTQRGSLTGRKRKREESKPKSRKRKTETGKTRKRLKTNPKAVAGKAVAKKSGRIRGKGKRASDLQQPLKPSKKSRAESGGYTMNVINAAADIEDILRDNKYTDIKSGDVARPDSQRLVTPPVEIRKVTLVTYRADMRGIIDEIYKRKFGTPTSKAGLPQTPAARSAWLKAAEGELGVARAEVKRLVDSANSPAQGKMLRLAAYRLRLVRALHTLGLVSGEPAASEEDIKDGLKGRLRDWILYEKAWLAAETLTLQRAGISDELYYTIREQNSQRRKNIRQWGRMLKGFDAKPEALDTEEVTDVKPTQLPEVTYDLGSELEDEDEDEDESEDDGQGDPDVTMVEEPSEDEGVEIAAKTVKEYTSLPEIRLTADEIENGKVNLENALSPRRPSSSSFMLDVSTQRRQRNWFENRERPTWRGRPVSPWTYTSKIDPFAGAGPPDWQKLPKETVWDRFQYMWVLTYWRIFQLHLLEK